MRPRQIRAGYAARCGPGPDGNCIFQLDLLLRRQQVEAGVISKGHRPQACAVGEVAHFPTGHTVRIEAGNMCGVADRLSPVFTCVA